MFAQTILLRKKNRKSCKEELLGDGFTEYDKRSVAGKIYRYSATLLQLQIIIFILVIVNVINKCEVCTYVQNITLATVGMS